MIERPDSRPVMFHFSPELKNKKKSTVVEVTSKTGFKVFRSNFSSKFSSASKMTI